MAMIANARAEHRGATWTLRLWGIRDRRLDLVATVATLALLAWSRFALLPSGPWEWDEALFARGVLHFDLPAHFPQPPGFPLWLALGWLLRPLVAEPLRGFQLLSALASCLTLFPLAALGRRVAPAPVAAVAALAVLAAPGVWLHAPRGFTDTAAAFLMFWAAALLMDRLDGRRATAFTLLLTAAFLVRPILLPELGLLWLFGAVTVRPRRRLAGGVITAAIATALAVAGMVWAQGSWTQFAHAFTAHGKTHAINLVLHNPGGVLDLGYVKSLGGPWYALAITLLALLGTAVWARRVSRRSAATWLALLLVAFAQLVWLQNRRFPRYAVPLHEAAAPLLAGVAAAAAPPVVAAAALVALGGAWAISTYPLLVEQHRTLLPGWEAARFAVAAAKTVGHELVVEPGLYPFLSYLEELDRARGAPWTFTYVLSPGSPDAKGLPHGPYLLVTDYPLHYGGPLWGGARDFAGVSDALRPLTQGRFLKARVVQNVPLPLAGWWLPEEAPDGALFRWGSPGASLLLPPLPPGTAVEIRLEPAKGKSTLVVAVNRRDVAEVAGDAGEQRIWIAPSAFAHDAVNRLTFERAESFVPGGGDNRSLALRLWELRALGPELAWQGGIANATERARLRVEAAGVFDAERFGAVLGCWTGPSARLWLPAGAGHLWLDVMAPRPTTPELEILTRGRRVAGPLQLGPGLTQVAVNLAASDMTGDGVALELRSRPYCPAREGGGSDTRELGVVLSAVRFEPEHPVPGAELFSADVRR